MNAVCSISSLLSNPANKISTGGGSVSPIYPTNVANIQLWFSAQDYSSLTIVTEGSNNNVTQWNDISGNGRNATKYNTANTSYAQYVATSSINSKPSLYFLLNQGMYCTLPIGSLTNGGTVFCVYKSNVGTSPQGSVFNRTMSNLPGPVDVYTTSRLIGSSSSWGQVTSTLNLGSNTSVNLVIFSFNNTSWYEWDNGKSLLSSTGNNFGYNDNENDKFYFCTRGDGTQVSKDTRNFMTGYYGELIVYDGILSANNRQGIESYLKDKWSFTYSGYSS